ncbi:MAG: FCD domain-containing protein [Lentilitoribacter sp.]
MNLSKKKHITVVENLRNILENIAPDVGDRLPSERELSKLLGCSRETLRKCLTILEEKQEIWRHVGQGTFRGKRPNHLPIRDAILINGVTPPDVIRARLLLEPQVAAEAARHATSKEIELLRKKIRNGKDAKDRLDCEVADDNFHRAIAQVANNPLLIQVLSFFSGTRRRVAWQREWDRTYRRIGVDEFQTTHSDQHEKIVDAISLNDPEAAEAAMKIHLQTIEIAISGSKHRG